MTISVKVRVMMRAKGFIPATRIAEQTGYTSSAVRRWVAEGKVKGIMAGGEMFVDFETLVFHIGDEAARALGVLELDPARPLVNDHN